MYNLPTIRFVFFVLFFIVSTFYSFPQSSFLPSDIPGLQIWLSSDSGLTVNGSSVQQWKDRSGKNNHAIQNTTANQPIFVGAQPLLNYKPVIRFDGVDDYMQFSELSTIRTVFFVVKHATGNQSYAPLLGHPSFYDFISDNNFLFNSSYTSQNILKGNGFINGGTVIPTAMIKPKQYTILSLITSGNVTAKYITNDRDKYGYWNGDYTEIIIYDTTLSTPQRQQVEQYLRYKYAPPVNLGADIILKNFCDTILDASPRFVSYKWHTVGQTDNPADTNQIFKTNNIGSYWVGVMDIFGFQSSDTVKVTSPLNQLADATICYGDTLVWNTGLKKSTYIFQWQDGSNDSLYKITKAGKYWVKVTDTIMGCSATSNTVTIAIDSFPLIASLGNDISICAGNFIALTQGITQVKTYLWKGGSTNTSLQVQKTDTFWVTVTDTIGCKKTDTINVTIKGAAPLVNFSATSVCKGDSTAFTDSSISSNGIINTWLWDFGDGKKSSSKNPTHLYTQSNTYPVTLTVTTNLGCSNSNTKNNIVYPFPVTSFSNVPSICAGVAINFKDSSKLNVGTIANWQWNFGDTTSGNNNTSILQNPSHLFSKEDEYYVKLIVVSNQGCKDSTIKFIKVLPVEACFTPNQLSGLKLWLIGDSVDSHNRVGQWKDLSGNNNHAIQNTIVNQPLYVGSQPLLNNKPVIRYDGVDDYMQFSELSNIRSAFFVVKHASGNQNYAPLLGHPSFYDFISGAKNLFDASFASPYILKGNDFMNGISVVPTAMIKPMQYTIISLITSGNVTAEYITNDRNKYGYWNGDYAEIILYDTALTTTQRQQVEQYLRYKYAPPVNLGPDIVLKNLCDTTIDASPRFLSYKWHTVGKADNPVDTNRTFKANKTGSYWVEVTDIFGFQSADTVKVTSPLNQLSNTKICYGDTLVWNTGLKNNPYSFQWQDGSNDSLFSIMEGGNYWVKVTDSLGCALISDTITVTIDSFPQIATLGPDTSLCTGNSISLKQGANGVQSYLWNDGSIASSLSIQNAGQYWVKATNSNGCIKQDTIDITIKGTAPTPLFSNDSITCQKNQIQFTDESTVSSGNSIVAWKWDFGDNITSTSQNPTHIYADTGNYIASLTITANTGCSNTILKNITINPLPTVDFSNTGACSKANIQLNDLSIVIGSQINQWNWNFGDMASGTNNSSILQNPIHLYNDSGNYNIHLIVKSTKGCIDSISKTIHIKPSPIANFTSTLGCTKEPVIFTNTSIIPPPETISNRSWDFHNGKTSTLPNPKQTYSSTGTYDVTLKITASNGCSSDTTKTININDKPFADYTFNNNCLNSASIFTDMSTVDNDSIIKWNWRFSNSDISLLPTPSYTFKDTGNYPVRLLITSSAGCADSVTKKVSIKPLPIADFSFNPMFGDSPLNVNFTNQSSGASSYVWNFGDGNRDSLSANPVHLFQDTGRYTIVLTAIDNKGCSSSTTQLLQVSPEFIDIALLDVKTTIDNNNYLSISIGMLNMGTRPINYIELLVKADGNLAIKELWKGALNVGEYTTYNFSSSIQLAENNSYVCINLINPNLMKDDNPNNNEQCFPLRKDVFIVPEPYPNPVSDELTIPLIVPLDGEAQINLFDMKADVAIANFKMNAIKGFNQLTFKTSSLAPGVYAYSVSFNGEKIVKRFIKVRTL